MATIDDLARGFNEAGMDHRVATSLATTLAKPFTNAAVTIAAPVTTGVITPANAVYTVVDQTALADAVLSLATAVNAIRAALTAAGIRA